jgi:NAD(P)-dependent dehydrogenase (short-subunit alcohol dehydrogenase family)
VLATVSPGKTVEGFGGKDIHIYAIDLNNEEAVADLTGTLIGEFKEIHAALLLAGGFAMGNIQNTDDDALRRMYSLNFETAYHVARPLFLHMLENNSGRIIFIGSRPSLEPSNGRSKLAYALSKAHLFKLAEYLNAEGDKKNVAAYVLVPDAIDTPDNRQAMPGADFSKWVKPEAMAEIMGRLCDEKIVLTEKVVKLY